MRIVFNSSMPRSGSELLQGILSQHPDVSAGSTSPLLEYVFGAAKNLDTQEARSQPDSVKHFDAFAKQGLLGYAKSFTKEKKGSSVYLDKSRGWVYYYPMVERIMGKPVKVVCMVRDLAEVVASMEHLHRKSANVMGDPMQEVTTGERVDKWLKSTPVGLALRRITNALDQKYAGIMYVRYEDLCADPKRVMDSILEHLELEPFEFDFDNISKAASEDERVFWNGADGLHTIDTKMTPATQRADELFGEVVAGRIRAFSPGYQRFFGYALPEQG